tara:strand:- start:1156 stop:1431 length:276 start_codon:yes stop_codon:yes gene_type:complete
MTIKQTIIPVCYDCHIYSTGDLSPFDYYYSEEESEQRIADIEKAMDEIQEEHPNSWITAGNKIDDFSIHFCRCCGSDLAGERFELLITTNN